MKQVIINTELNLKGVAIDNNTCDLFLWDKLEKSRVQLISLYIKKYNSTQKNPEYVGLPFKNLI